MALNGVLHLTVVFSILLISNDAFYKYDILFRDEKIYSPCDNPNLHFIYEYVDFTNMQFEYQYDGSLYIHGHFTMITDIGNQSATLAIDIFKKTRGEWVPTVYSIRRPSFCTAIFDPTELWYMFFKHVEDKTCPLRKGQILNMNTSTALSVILPDPRFEGDFKIQIIVDIKQRNEIACVNILAEFHKVPYFG